MQRKLQGTGVKGLGVDRIRDPTTGEMFDIDEMKKVYIT